MWRTKNYVKRRKRMVKKMYSFWQEEDAVGVVEIILILVGILTPIIE